MLCGGRDGERARAGAASGRPRPYSDIGPPMLLIAEPGTAAAADAEAGIALAGGRVLRQIGWTEVAAVLPRLAGWPVVVAEAAGVQEDEVLAALPAIAAYVEQAAAPAVVTIAADQIDCVAAQLLDRHAVLLCEPALADRVAALAAASAPGTPVLHDAVQEETDKERLQRLNSEVAHIARLLAGLTRHEPSPAAARVIADRRRGFDSEPAALGQSVGALEVRRVIQLRRLRAKFFGQFVGDGLFEDPAWDMLLDLFAAELEGTRVSVSSLCIAAGVAPTTALRWIAKMSEMGLFIRHPDPVDRRRAFMALSPRASEAMRSYMLAARKVDAG